MKRIESTLVENFMQEIGRLRREGKDDNSGLKSSKADLPRTEDKANDKGFPVGRDENV